MTSQKNNPLGMVLALSVIFFSVFVMASGFVYLVKGQLQAEGGRKNASLFKTAGKVGIIEVNGVILDSKKLVKRIEAFDEDESIKALVVRINSPGGAVAPSQEIYEALKGVKKPVVASMASVAASGGYYIAVAAKKIFANPGTITGSIGVIMEFANLEKLYEWAKIKRMVIKTGKFKDTGSPSREMTPEDRALLQGMVDDVLVQFKQAVGTGRKLKEEEVDAVADGRIFSGAQAKAAKLVDDLGTFNDAVTEAGKLAGIKGRPTLVYPERPATHWLEALMREGRDEDAESRGPSGSSGVYRLLWGGISGVLGLDQGGAAAVDSGSKLVLGFAQVLPPGIYWVWKEGVGN
jgi:protease-4